MIHEVSCFENILGMTAPLLTRGCASQARELLRSLDLSWAEGSKAAAGSSRSML